MASQQNRTVPHVHSWFLSLIEPLPLDTAERIRLHQFSVFLLTGIPTLVVFGIYHLTKGDPRLGLIACMLAATLGASRLLLRSLRSGLIIYRINAALFAGLLLYMVILGGIGGSKALWMFVFPLIAFFLLGTWEGLAWTAGLYLVAVCLASGAVHGLHTFRYEGEFATRFSMTYWIITAIGCWFEFLRQHYRNGMEAERQRLMEEQNLLREALAKVKQLSGLLPICASCKKIRDDQGHWVPIESYIRIRSEAEFSHSICPDCGEQLDSGRHRSH